MPSSTTTLGPAIARLGQTFPSTEAYLDFWRAHPALAEHWTPDVEAYVRYDLTGEPGQLRSRAVEDAVRADGRDVLADKPFTEALQRLTKPTPLLTAPAGMLGAPPPLIPPELIAAWTERVPGAAAAGGAGDEPLHDPVREGGRGGRVPGDQVGRALTVNVSQLTEARTGSFGMLVDVVAPGGALVLSGAGLSTESGIPDYRGPTGLARRR